MSDSEKEKEERVKGLDREEEEERMANGPVKHVRCG